MELLYPELLGGMSWEQFLQLVKVKADVKTAYRETDPSTLSDVFAALEVEQVRVAVLMMNARNYADVRKFGSNILDPETSRENLSKGLMAKMWGADVVVHKNVPMNTIVALSEPTDGRLVAILHLAVDTFLGADDIIKYYDELKELSKELQSTINKAANLMHSFITTVERH